ncbi:MAG: helix-turn-helix domain-containing protein [Deltaproteobacteria bacterium]|jgi:predicted transcriptional regulator|nr:helix-turn-helix domain-containing protein [Deltaproteobacteria bacterium]
MSVYPDGRAIARLRKSLLLTPAEVANKTEVSSPTIHRIEHGLPCRVSTLREYLLALGVELYAAQKYYSYSPPVEVEARADEELLGAEPRQKLMTAVKVTPKPLSKPKKAKKTKVARKRP